MPCLAYAIYGTICSSSFYYTYLKFSQHTYKAQIKQNIGRYLKYFFILFLEAVTAWKLSGKHPDDPTVIQEIIESKATHYKMVAELARAYDAQREREKLVWEAHTNGLAIPACLAPEALECMQVSKY